MGCVSFWLDNPINALMNIKSIIPRPGQCIDEKLNGLSLFVILFTAALALANVKHFWIFGVIGLFLVVMVKLFFFNGRKGKASIEEYMNGAIPLDNIDEYMDYSESEVYEPEELAEEQYFRPIYEDDLALTPGLNNTGDSWDEIKQNVGDQIAHARFPGLTHGCWNSEHTYW